MRQFRVGDTITFSDAPDCVVWKIVAKTISGYDVIDELYEYGEPFLHHVTFLGMANNAKIVIPYIEPEPKFTRDEIVGMFAR